MASSGSPEAEELARLDREDRERTRRLVAALGDIWATYEREIGPLATASDEDIRQLLEIVRLAGPPYMVRRDAAELILRRLLAQLTGQTRRRRGRRSRAWRERGFEAALVAEARARKAQLVATGEAPEDAWEKARDEAATASGLAPSTLDYWAEHPGRRRPK